MYIYIYIYKQGFFCWWWLFFVLLCFCFLSRETCRSRARRGESRRLVSTAGVSLSPPHQTGGRDNGDAGARVSFGCLSGFLGEICDVREA